MTCVAAIVDRSVVWMGADSAGVGGLSLSVRRDPKIYRVGVMLIGFTTSFRMGQLLGHTLKLPAGPKRKADLRRWMNVEFIDAVRKCLKEGGYARKDNEVEQGGNFLVGYRGCLFEICSDYQVEEHAAPYCAVGCGFALAQGSLHTTHHLPMRQHPRVRLTSALKAAEAFSAGVRGPFLIERTPNGT